MSKKLSLIPNKQLSPDEQYLLDIGIVTLRLAELLPFACLHEKARIQDYLEKRTASSPTEKIEEMGDSGITGT